MNKLEFPGRKPGGLSGRKGRSRPAAWEGGTHELAYGLLSLNVLVLAGELVDDLRLGCSQGKGVVGG